MHVHARRCTRSLLRQGPNNDGFTVPRDSVPGSFDAVRLSDRHLWEQMLTLLQR